MVSFSNCYTYAISDNGRHCLVGNPLSCLLLSWKISCPKEDRVKSIVQSHGESPLSR